MKKKKYCIQQFLYVILTTGYLRQPVVVSQPVISINLNAKILFLELSYKFKANNKTYGH